MCFVFRYVVIVVENFFHYVYCNSVTGILVDIFSISKEQSVVIFVNVCVFDIVNKANRILDVIYVG
jgi:hypothetical protein